MLEEGVAGDRALVEADDLGPLLDGPRVSSRIRDRLYALSLLRCSNWAAATRMSRTGWFLSLFDQHLDLGQIILGIAAENHSRAFEMTSRVGLKTS